MNPEIITRDRYSRVIAVTEWGIVDEATPMDESRIVAESLKKDPRIRDVLIPSPCLCLRISALADDIVRDFPKSAGLHLLVVLTGSFVFAADLGRALCSRGRGDVVFHLIKTSVYDKAIKGPGDRRRAVRLDLAPGDIRGKDILVVEDILDQGFTLNWIRDYLIAERGVASVKICGLLDKQLETPTEEVRKLRADLRLDYTGFTIPDVWVAGYGVDAAQEMRNLPCVVSIHEHLFK